VNSTYFTKVGTLIKKILQKKSADIDQSAVTNDIYSEMDTFAGYYLMLTLANLIALCGLLINSSPVIIGAMLISPLMGPMLSFGFSFITGDKVIWRKSVKKLTLSVVATILVAGLASYISPLAEPTHEIMSRTTPNLYDLFIAFFAGTAGAAAICTKKNYMTIVPGVAIATAVIPPLSVTGFGLGTGNFHIAAGGFLLYFTNFVAIVLSACVVFYTFGFRPTRTSSADRYQIKRRFLFLSLVLCIISIPLIYTLWTTISDVRLKKDIQSILKSAYDRQGLSKLSGFTYAVNDQGMLEVNAFLDTVHYIQDAMIPPVERQLGNALQMKVRLNLEQVKVLQGGLKDIKPRPPSEGLLITQKRSSRELIRTSQDNFLAAIRPSLDKIDAMISPSRIEDFSVGFLGKGNQISIHLRMLKDSPLSDDQVLWLNKLCATDLKIPVVLSIETVPFVPLLHFNIGEVDMTAEMKKQVEIIRDVYSKAPEIRILIESWAESPLPYRKRIALAKQRAEVIKAELTGQCHVPDSRIHSVIMHTTLKKPAARVSIITGGKDEVR